MERYISGAPSSFSGSGGGIVYTPGNDLELSGTTFSLKDTIDVKDITAVDISGLGLYNLSGNGILINNSGFVGINLSGASPTHHLDVSGNVRITGDLTVSGDNISGVNITATQFLGNLSGDNISGVDITASDISSNHIYGHSISGVNISGDHIYGTNISGVNISGDHIYGHSISGVNISGEHIYGTNISGVNISGEHIYGTNISGVNISGDHIYGTTISGAGVVQTSSDMTVDNDTKLATSKAIKEYIAANSSTSDKYVHIYNSGFQTSYSIKNFWIPIRSFAEVPNSTAGNPLNSMERCTFIAPHNGIVKKILFRTETSMSSSSEPEASFKLCKADSGVELPSLSNQVGNTYNMTSLISQDVTYSNTSMSEGTGQWALVAGVLYGLNISMVVAPLDMVFCMVVEYTF